MGIFYVLFIYVLQGYFGNWTKKEPLKFEELGMHNTVAPDDRTSASGRPDGTETGFPVLPLKRYCLFKSLFKAFFQATRKKKERIER